MVQGGRIVPILFGVFQFLELPIEKSRNISLPQQVIQGRIGVHGVG
jgi:hypothetical protein